MPVVHPHRRKSASAPRSPSFAFVSVRSLSSSTPRNDAAALALASPQKGPPDTEKPMHEGRDSLLPETDIALVAALSPRSSALPPPPRHPPRHCQSNRRFREPSTFVLNKHKQDRAAWRRRAKTNIEALIDTTAAAAAAEDEAILSLSLPASKRTPSKSARRQHSKSGNRDGLSVPVASSAESEGGHSLSPSASFVSVLCKNAKAQMSPQASSPTGARDLLQRASESALTAVELSSVLNLWARLHGQTQGSISPSGTLLASLVDKLIAIEDLHPKHLALAANALCRLSAFSVAFHGYLTAPSSLPRTLEKANAIDLPLLSLYLARFGDGGVDADGREREGSSALMLPQSPHSAAVWSLVASRALGVSAELSGEGINALLSALSRVWWLGGNANGWPEWREGGGAAMVRMLKAEIRLKAASLSISQAASIATSLGSLRSLDEEVAQTLVGVLQQSGETLSARDASAFIRVFSNPAAFQGGQIEKGVRSKEGLDGGGNGFDSSKSVAGSMRMRTSVVLSLLPFVHAHLAKAAFADLVEITHALARTDQPHREVSEERDAIGEENEVAGLEGEEESSDILHGGRFSRQQKEVGRPRASAVRDPVLLRDLSAQLCARLDSSVEVEAHHLTLVAADSLLLWRRQKGGAVFESCLNRIGRQGCSSMGPQDVSAMLQAVSRSGLGPEIARLPIALLSRRLSELLQAGEGECLGGTVKGESLGGTVNPQSVSVALWALGKMKGPVQPDLLLGLCLHAEARAGEYSKEDVCTGVVGISLLWPRFAESIMETAPESELYGSQTLLPDAGGRAVESLCARACLPSSLGGLDLRFFFSAREVTEVYLAVASVCSRFMSPAIGSGGPFSFSTEGTAHSEGVRLVMSAFGRLSEEVLEHARLSMQPKRVRGGRAEESERSGIPRENVWDQADMVRCLEAITRGGEAAGSSQTLSETVELIWAQLRRQLTTLTASQLAKTAASLVRVWGLRASEGEDVHTREIGKKEKNTTFKRLLKIAEIVCPLLSLQHQQKHSGALPGGWGGNAEAKMAAVSPSSSSSSSSSVSVGSPWPLLSSFGVSWAACGQRDFRLFKVLMRNANRSLSAYAKTRGVGGEEESPYGDRGMSVDTGGGDLSGSSAGSPSLPLDDVGRFAFAVARLGLESTEGNVGTREETVLFFEKLCAVLPSEDLSSSASLTDTLRLLSAVCLAGSASASSSKSTPLMFSDRSSVTGRERGRKAAVVALLGSLGLRHRAVVRAFESSAFSGNLRVCLASAVWELGVTEEDLPPHARLTFRALCEGTFRDQSHGRRGERERTVSGSEGAAETRAGLLSGLDRRHALIESLLHVQNEREGGEGWRGGERSEARDRGKGERTLVAEAEEVLRRYGKTLNLELVGPVPQLPYLVRTAALLRGRDREGDAVSEGVPLAIEMGEPEDFHFELDGSQIEWKPFALLRHRVLRAMGWRVIPVAYFEWEAQKNSFSKAALVRKKVFSVASAEESAGNWTRGKEEGEGVVFGQGERERKGEGEGGAVSFSERWTRGGDTTSREDSERERVLPSGAAQGGGVEELRWQRFAAVFGSLRQQRRLERDLKRRRGRESERMDRKTLQLTNAPSPYMVLPHFSCSQRDNRHATPAAAATKEKNTGVDPKLPTPQRTEPRDASRNVATLSNDLQRLREKDLQIQRDLNARTRNFASLREGEGKEPQTPADPQQSASPLPAIRETIISPLPSTVAGETFIDTPTKKKKPAPEEKGKQQKKEKQKEQDVGGKKRPPNKKPSSAEKEEKKDRKEKKKKETGGKRITKPASPDALSKGRDGPASPNLSVSANPTVAARGRQTLHFPPPIAARDDRSMKFNVDSPEDPAHAESAPTSPPLSVTVSKSETPKHIADAPHAPLSPKAHCQTDEVPEKQAMPGGEECKQKPKKKTPTAGNEKKKSQEGENNMKKDKKTAGCYKGSSNQEVKSGASDSSPQPPISPSAPRETPIGSSSAVPATAAKEENAGLSMTTRDEDQSASPSLGGTAPEEEIHPTSPSVTHSHVLQHIADAIQLPLPSRPQTSGVSFKQAALWEKGWRYEALQALALKAREGAFSHPSLKPVFNQYLETVNVAHMQTPTDLPPAAPGEVCGGGNWRKESDGKFVEKVKETPKHADVTGADARSASKQEIIGVPVDVQREYGRRVERALQGGSRKYQ
uniref:RAP domain-containing protein n=1 Tax=Chromera velia CCMP2878 TaxID=1169474 RepID=A0A0G4IAB3_9ALVE|eukprot:Cvel_2098.t1-p1 / transcript=Cvel_2098.t1 / gene=Cvel_2098 / organism=Chromera_velia_CCMP2878 / gene_product=hypothetical protein / transcript_product=hypothetical protein / location=Cvel_scaffold81:7007-22328(-) / protein_length=2174 / sequence_SO=supercontig / SO=protein_coding / is_pseudo=false